MNDVQYVVQGEVFGGLLTTTTTAVGIVGVGVGQHFEAQDRGLAADDVLVALQEKIVLQQVQQSYSSH